MAQTYYRKNLPISAPGFRLPRKAARNLVNGNVVPEIVCATFDPSANSAQRPVGAYGLGVYLPAKAIITRAWIDVVTTFTSAGADAGTIAIHAQSAGDIVAAVAISAAGDVWDAGVHGAKPGNFALDGNALTQINMAAALSATAIKMTAEREITATVAVQALTAGKANIFVEYIVSS